MDIPLLHIYSDQITARPALQDKQGTRDTPAARDRWMQTSKNCQLQRGSTGTHKMLMLVGRPKAEKGTRNMNDNPTPNTRASTLLNVTSLYCSVGDAQASKQISPAELTHQPPCPLPPVLIHPQNHLLHAFYCYSTG